MNGLFVDLENEAFFCDFIMKKYVSPPSFEGEINFKNEVDRQRVIYSFTEYKQNVNKFAVLLRSNNPDHYKRSGALLHALYQSSIIASVADLADEIGSLDDIETGFARITYGEAQVKLKYVDFYREFHNQMIAFDIAYRCCCSYEPIPRKLNFDYTHNMCRYLKENNNLNVDSLFMIFKSLMV